MKTFLCGMTLALAGLFASADTAAAGIGFYVGFGPPAYPAYSAPPVVYSAPYTAYRPVPVAYGVAPLAYPAVPAYGPSPYGALGAERYRARVRYRPLHGDLVYRYRGRGRW